MKISYQRLLKVLVMGIGLMACSQFILLAQDSSTFFKRIPFGNNSDAGTAIIEADDGYILLGGGTEFGSPIITSTKIAKIDYTGNILWQKTYGKPYHIWRGGSWGAIVKTYDGNYVSGGGVEDTSGVRNPFVFKFNEQGDTLWTKAYAKPRYTLLLDLVQTPDSGFAFLGYTAMPNGNFDYYLMRTDQDGNLLWEKTYGAANDDFGLGIDLTPDGGFILSGGTDNFGNGQTDGWNIKVEPTSGQIQWEKTYGTIGDDCGSFTRHLGGYFYLMKQCVDTLINTTDFNEWTNYVAKLYPNGDIIWQTFFNSPEVLRIYNIVPMPDDEYVLMGSKSESLLKKSKIWVAKIGSDGDISWEREYVLEENNSYYITDVALAPDGGLVFSCTAGGFSGSGGSDVMALKLDSMGCFTPGCDTLNVSIETLIPGHEGLSVWPNPVRNNLHIEFCPDIFIQQPKAVLYTLDGKIVFQKRLSPTNRCLEAELSLPDLPNGLYHLALYDNDRIVAREKVMVR